jgi:hypothetical protein
MIVHHALTTKCTRVESCGLGLQAHVMGDGTSSAAANFLRSQFAEHHSHPWHRERKKQGQPCRTARSRANSVSEVAQGETGGEGKYTCLLVK